MSPGAFSDNSIAPAYNIKERGREPRNEIKRGGDGSGSRYIPRERGANSISPAGDTVMDRRDDGDGRLVDRVIFVGGV